MKKNKFLFCIGLLLTVATIVNAQSVTWISSTEGNVWQKSKVKLQSKSEQNPVLQVDGTENGVAFKNWGTTFNELCWDALGLLTRTEQDEILYNIFLRKVIYGLRVDEFRWEPMITLVLGIVVTKWRVTLN